MDALNKEEEEATTTSNENVGENERDKKEGEAEEEEEKKKEKEPGNNSNNSNAVVINTNNDGKYDDQNSTKGAANNSTATSTDTTNNDDDTLTLLSLLDEATQLAAEEKVLASARVLSKIIEMEGKKDDNSNISSSILKEEHHCIMKRAKDCESTIADLRTTTADDSSPEGAGWTKLGQTAGTSEKNLFLPSMVYYKVGNGSKLTCRMETPIAESLLIPLLSVLNETDLFTEWLPSWNTPRIGIRTVKELTKTGLASRKLQIITDSPWPMNPRELLMDVMAVDDIDHGGYCAVRLSNIPEEERKVNPAIPPPDPTCVPVTFEGIFLFEACPANYSTVVENPQLVKHMPHDEPLLLVTFKMWNDPQLSALPPSIINFVTKNVIGRMWEVFLRIAEKVKDGVMPKHKEAIALHPGFYAWMEGRIQKMLQQLKEEEQQEEGQIKLCNN